MEAAAVLRSWVACGSAQVLLEGWLLKNTLLGAGSGWARMWFELRPLSLVCHTAQPTQHRAGEDLASPCLPSFIIPVADLHEVSIHREDTEGQEPEGERLEMRTFDDMRHTLRHAEDAGTPSLAEWLSALQQRLAVCREEEPRACVHASSINQLARPGVEAQADEDAPCCTSCEAVFGLLVRRHHCRNCGRVYCSSCTSSAVVAGCGPVPVRVCRDCFVVCRLASEL